MPEVREEVVNVRLAEILSRDFGIDCRAERVKGRRRPDIRCYYKGFIVGIEASYSRSDAERDAESRVEQELADIALALWIKQKFRDVPEERLSEIIRKSVFDIRIFVPLELRGLLRYLEASVKRKVEPATSWFENVDLPTIRDIIENSVEFMIREEGIEELIEEMKSKFNEFINTLQALDGRGVVRRNIYSILYRLYGLSVAEAQDPDVAFGHAALSILLSTVFYEHVRGVHPELKPVTDYIQRLGPIEGLRRALEDLLKIDYRVAVEATIEILGTLPSAMSQRVRGLIDLAVRIASNRSLLRRDFAGRLYHSITGDIALRKGLATFYTEVPAAYLLATLAVSSLLGLDERGLPSLDREKAREIASRVASLKVGDLACGSGTLLTASYSALMRAVATLKFYYNLDDVDVESIGRRLIEEGIYGVDALRYASQITAINLALMAPSTIRRENVYTIYLGYIQERNQAWLGSLELLNNTRRVGGLLAYIEGGLRGEAERVTVEGSEGVFSLPPEFDLVIMNPPFTRATGRTERFEEETAGERGLFGFIVDARAREGVVEAYERVRRLVRSGLRSIAVDTANLLPKTIRNIVLNKPREFRQYLAVGQAGEGLLFLYLAYKYVKNGGVIAFVLPRGLLAGTSWFLARTLLASKFHVKYVIVSSDPKRGYNFSEGTSLSEVLIVARRIDSHSDGEETVFVNLLSKPETALEAVMLAEEVMRSASTRREGIVEVGGSKAVVFKVSRRQLLNHIDNWNKFVAVPNKELLEYTLNLYDKGEVVL
jgi:hypothetical protein